MRLQDLMEEKRDYNEIGFLLYGMGEIEDKVGYNQTEKRHLNTTEL